MRDRNNAERNLKRAGLAGFRIVDAGTQVNVARRRIDVEMKWNARGLCKFELLGLDGEVDGPDLPVQQLAILAIGNNRNFDLPAAHAILIGDEGEPIRGERKVDGIARNRESQRRVVPGASAGRNRLGIGLRNTHAIAKLSKVGHSPIHQRAQRVAGRGLFRQLHIFGRVLEVAAAVSQFVVAVGGTYFNLALFAYLFAIGWRISKGVVSRPVVNVRGQRLPQRVALIDGFAASNPGNSSI